MSSRNSEYLHPAIAAILERHKKKSKPLQRKDPYKIGLVVEGGSLRAVVSAAELVALGKMSLTNSFDIVYGESVGAGNAAWFLSGQLERAIAAYYEYVNTRSFFNPLRLFIGGPIVNIQYLEERTEELYPLDFSRLQQSGVELHVLAARVDYARDSDHPSYPIASLANFKDKADLLYALRAAVQMPLLCGAPIGYRGMRLWDAGIIDKFPIQKAIEDKCTHILALSTNPSNYVPKQYSFLERFVTTTYLNHFNPDLSRHFLQSVPNYKRTLEMLRVKNQTKRGPPFIFTIFLPAYVNRLHHFEMNRKVLQKAILAATEATLKTFSLIDEV